MHTRCRARPTWVRSNEYRPDASALAVEGLPEKPSGPVRKA